MIANRIRFCWPAALKQIVDPAIGQPRSLVDFDRLRFDFHCPRAVTAAELEQIEALINGWISEAHTLQVAEMVIEPAEGAGRADCKSAHPVSEALIPTQLSIRLMSCATAIRPVRIERKPL
jgi:hypothetical protein